MVLDSTTIEKLPIEFIGKGEVSGSKFKQVFESDNAYIYEVETKSGTKHYEVFKKQTTAICIDFENRKFSETKFKEVYPKSNKWGVSAWSCNTIDRAFEKLDEIEYNANKNLK